MSEEIVKPPKTSSGAASERTEAIVQFLMAVCTLKGFSYAERVTDITLQLWEDALSDLGPAQIRRAMNHLVRTMESGTYWPTPGDVRKLLRKAATVGAEQAWGQIRRQLENHQFDPDAGWVWEWTASQKRADEWTAAGRRLRRDSWDRGWHLLPASLSPEAEYALTAVGGWERVREQLGGREHDFVHRGFIEAFTQAQEHPELTDHQKAALGPLSGASGGRLSDGGEHGG